MSERRARSLLNSMDERMNPKLEIPSRAVAALLGGYVLSNSIAILLAAVGPGDRAEAVTWALLSSFLVYTAAVIWVFSVRSARRAWVGLLLPAGTSALLAWFLLQGAQP